MMHNRIIRITLVLSMCLSVLLFSSACNNVSDERSTSTAITTVQTDSSVSETENTIAPDVGTTTADETTGSVETTEEYSKVLVVYFSHTGTTKAVSEYLHGIVGGDLIELEPVNPYPEGYSDALDPAKQEQIDNARPEIANTIEHFESYEVIYLGYPIWWGTTPMIINTFLESYDFTGKTVIPYATSGGSGISQSIKDIRSEIPNADVKDGLLVKSNDDIIPWLQELGMY